MPFAFPSRFFRLILGEVLVFRLRGQSPVSGRFSGFLKPVPLFQVADHVHNIPAKP